VSQAFPAKIAILFMGIAFRTGAGGRMARCMSFMGICCIVMRHFVFAVIMGRTVVAAASSMIMVVPVIMVVVVSVVVVMSMVVVMSVVMVVSVIVIMPVIVVVVVVMMHFVYFFLFSQLVCSFPCA